MAISLLDVADGDPEAEEDEPDSLDGDEQDTAWFEGIDQTRTSPNVEEDSEEDDPDEDDDPLEVAWLEDRAAVIEPPKDWAMAWNASIRGEDMEDGGDREGVWFG